MAHDRGVPPRLTGRLESYVPALTALRICCWSDTAFLIAVCAEFTDDFEAANSYCFFRAKMRILLGIEDWSHYSAH